MATMSFLKRFPLSLILNSLLFGQPGSTKCNMVLDEFCNAVVWQDQYRCIMENNSLQTLMDCVNIKKTSGETAWCRDADKWNDPGEDRLFTKDNIDGVPVLCIKPRVVLLEGPQYRKGGWWDASLNGILNVCPDNDPDFFNCLCDFGVNERHIKQFARNFKKDLDQDFNCKQYTKRATLPEEIVALSSYNTTNFKRQIHARDEEIDPDHYYVDDFGQPVYDNGYVGFPLPYYDQGGLRVRNRPAAKRCYIDPVENYVAECTTWLIPTTTILQLATQPPKYSNFARAYTVSADATATAAPAIAANVTSVAPLPQVPATATITTSSVPAASSTKASKASNLMITSVESLLKLACFGIVTTLLIIS